MVLKKCSSKLLCKSYNSVNCGLTNRTSEEYELVLDASFWIQPYPVESFINKLSQHYANDVIITESQKIGFQPVKSKQHTDGSNTITLQRWNLKNSLSVL